MSGDPVRTVLDRVRALAARVLQVDEDLVGADTPLVGEMGAESIDLLELRFLAEKEFHVRVTVKELLESAGLRTADEVAKRLSPGLIARVIEERLGSKGKP